MRSWVQQFAVVTYLKVQVWASGPAGVAHRADDLSTLNCLPHPNVYITQVGIVGGKAVSVVDHDQVVGVLDGPQGTEQALEVPPAHAGGVVADEAVEGLRGLPDNGDSNAGTDKTGCQTQPG